MSKLKKWLTVGLIIILTIGVSGCMSNKAIMLKHLEEKYGQEFEIGRVGKEGFVFADGDYFTFACPKGGYWDTDSFRVQMDPKNKTSTGIKDGYFGILIREDVEAEVLAAVSDLTFLAKAYYNPSTYYDNVFDRTKTYADFKQWGIDRGKPFLFTVAVCVSSDNLDESEKEDYAKQIFDKLQKDNYRGMVNVLFYPGEAFEQLTRANTNELAKQYREQYTNITKNINLK